MPIFDANQLRKDIAAAEAQVASLKTRLDTIERSCRHRWDKTKYCPIIIRKAYHIPGDPAGTMGVDRQLPMDVPESSIAQWSRTCLDCGKTETTQNVKKEYQEGKIPGTGGLVDVPSFDAPHWSDRDSFSRTSW